MSDTSIMPTAGVADMKGCPQGCGNQGCTPEAEARLRQGRKQKSPKQQLFGQRRADADNRGCQRPIRPAAQAPRTGANPRTGRAGMSHVLNARKGNLQDCQGKDCAGVGAPSARGGAEGQHVAYPASEQHAGSSVNTTTPICHIAKKCKPADASACCDLPARQIGHRRAAAEQLSSRRPARMLRPTMRDGRQHGPAGPPGRARLVGWWPAQQAALRAK